MTDPLDELRKGPLHRIYDRQFRGKWRRCSGRGVTQEQSDNDVIEKCGFAQVIRRAETLVVIWDRRQKPPRLAL